VSARDAVLAAVRRAARHEATHPGAHPSPIAGANFDAFALRLATVGGEAFGPFGSAEFAPAVLAHANAWAEGGRIVAEPSAAALLGGAAIEVAGHAADPRSFADVAVAIARGAIAVAENGAVAVVGADAPHRSLLFLAERVILLVDAASVAGDLHAGMRTLTADAFSRHHVTWISGPSKTADIEQTLVFGAHGPRELAVFALRA
jgi:L-lactate utilization protein LutC